jgi:ABC-type lipoprotein release transport system permease subunit
VDWSNEDFYFNSLDYQGSFDISRAGANTIVLSTPLARQLGVQAGDSVILEAGTRYGQKNTGVFIVGGIVNDASIFGYYKAYIARITLNRLLLYEDSDCSMAGIFLADKRMIEKKRALFLDILARHISVGPLIKDRVELARARDDPWEGIRTFVISLSVYLSEVSDLLEALNIITYLLYGMMLLVIFVSAAVTYRLLLHERARELGTMRAIGFHGGDICFVLVVETCGLVLVSIVAGFILSLVLGWGISFVSFSWFPGFEIFLRDGRLRILYLPKTLIVNIMVIIGMMVLAVWIPAYRSSRYLLTKLLAGGDV